VDSDSIPQWPLDGKRIAFRGAGRAASDTPEGYFIEPDRRIPGPFGWRRCQRRRKEVWRSGNKPDDSFPYMADDTGGASSLGRKTTPS